MHVVSKYVVSSVMIISIMRNAQNNSINFHFYWIAIARQTCHLHRKKPKFLQFRFKNVNDVNLSAKNFNIVRVAKHLFVSTALTKYTQRENLAIT